MQQTFEEKYKNLNEAQKKAVDTIEGPVLVIAGPGSGKTELLSMRTANILKKTDTLASSILCLTFTDAASANMQKRLAQIIGAEAYKVAINTFHSFGTEIINRYQEYFYKGIKYEAVEDITKIEILENIIKTLKHNNPLNSYSEDHGYTYLKDIITRIGELKKGGLTAISYKKIIENNKQYLEQANKELSNFFENYPRINKQILADLPTLIKNLENITTEKENENYKTIKQVLIESLKEAYFEATDENSTKPITEWKKTYTEKNEENKQIFKDEKNTKKHLALAEVYEKYITEMKKQGYYDYDDMIMEVVNAMQKYQDLKYNIQEQYQYILVDEFQDTNGVQTKLIKLLLDAEVNEGSPNILAVGDDDQSIYKFQGAKLDNIINFKDQYKKTEIIVLQNNYRSTQEILDLIRKVIKKGKNRLENTVKTITKELIASNKTLKPGKIQEQNYKTQFNEFIWIAQDIKTRIKNGEDPKQIAVIAPKHRLLEELAKYLEHYKIPISYERKKNIFELPHIVEILKMLQFINTLNKANQKEADELLPEILSYDFFNIDKLEIWKISIDSYSANDIKNKKTWLETMLKHENKNIKNIASFFITLAGKSSNITGEEIIDYLTGVKELTINKETNETYKSPYKDYHFNDKEFKENKDKYIDYLTALQAYISKVREFAANKQILTLQTLVEFTELHQRHNLPINYETAFSNDENAVQLMSSHKSKGLEFETVYTPNCTDKTWMGKGHSSILKFPKNIPLSQEDNNEDDQLRLFYVTISRTKRNLIITHHDYKDNGKAENKLRFLEENEVKEKLKNIDKSEVENIQKEYAKLNNLEDFYALKFNIKEHQKITDTQNALLKKRLENYQLSVTHLNNFLDIQNAGPQQFIERNLLQFPEKQAPNASYGSAIHKTIEILHREYKKTGDIMPIEKLIETYKEILKLQRLNNENYKELEEKGIDQLTIYYKERKHDINKEDKIELNFKNEGVKIGEAQLTGKLDKVRIQNKTEAIVYDLKTGKPFNKWSNSRKPRNYKDQLIFYKILIENSRNYSKFKVNEGIIEFFEPQNDKIILLPLQITAQEVEELKQLIKIVYNKIINLDFPDTSNYPKDQNGKVTDKGVQQFKEDLLNGII